MSNHIEIFKLRKANERIAEAKVKPTPKMLFGEFWLENELCILFADTGKGKSILAVQIAESIARGKPIEPMQMTAPAQKVLYFDFELSDKQFEMRYAADPEAGQDFLSDHYELSDNFYSVEIDTDMEFPENFASSEEYLRAAVSDMIRSTGAKVVIIDNITYLRGANDTAREAIPLMRELRRLKKELGLSILVLAHTPKRNVSRRITVNDLQGSKALSNFADNIFAIGESNIDAGFRYVKHIKPRSTEMLYDSGNVLVGEIRKWEKNFLGFRFYKFSPESDHISREINPLMVERAARIKELSGQGKTQRQIAAEFNISVSTVNRYLHLALDEESDYFDLDDDFYTDEEENEPPAPVVETNLEGGPWWEMEKDPELRRHRYLMRYKLGPYAEDKGAAAVVDDGEDDEDEDEDPMGRYGLKGFDAKKTPVVEEAVEDLEDDAADDPLEWANRIKKVEVGEITRGKDGRLRRRTVWGWDYCAEAVE